MTQRSRIRAAVVAAIAAAAGCGYPTFSYGPGGGGAATTSSAAGGAGGAGSSSSTSSGGGGTTTSSTSSSSTSSSSSSSSNSSSSSSSTGGPTCPIDHLLISEVRSRGSAGASDDFVELYNPTESPIQLDSSWSLYAVSVGSFSYSKRWVGNSATVAPHGHYLIAGSGYAQSPAADGPLAPSITDAASVILDRGGVSIDVLCFYKDVSTSFGIIGYECEGTAILNPHDDTDPTNTNQSLERRPGGKFGHCVDTGDNASDFFVQAPATPQSSASMPAP